MPPSFPSAIDERGNLASASAHHLITAGLQLIEAVEGTATLDETLHVGSVVVVVVVVFVLQVIVQKDTQAEQAISNDGVVFRWLR